MAGTLTNLHMMVPSPACIKYVLKVKVEVKGSVSTCAHFMKHHYTLLPV